MQELFDVYEIILKDKEELITKIKPKLEFFLKKERFFRFIPIFRLSYDLEFKQQVKRQLFQELVLLTTFPIDVIMSILDDNLIESLLEQEGFYDKESYR